MKCYHKIKLLQVKPSFLMVYLSLISMLLFGDNKLSAELEGGLVWQSRNLVQIPNTSEGTRFSLVELVGTGPLPWARLYLNWNITNWHKVHILLAPLFYTKSGIPDTDINFCGETFQQGVSTDATYKFNSWRIGYSYKIVQRNCCNWWIGFTAKIRDAKIRLEQQGRGAEEIDLGFVPLLHIGLEQRISDKWRFIFDLEGLAGGPGRAFDGALKLRYYPSRLWGLSFGYRTVEGGADVTSVYNFAWIHYALVSLSVGIK